jgi:hypothetical protein
MKTVEQNVLLNELENKVEHHLQIATRDFQNMSAEELLTPGEQGGWSIAQCLEHLNRYGKYYLPTIKRALDQKNTNPSSPQFKSGWFGNYFTRMMNPETGKRKIKAFKSYVPPQTLDAHAVVAEFIEQQEILLTYLKLAANSDLNGIRIPISIAIWLRLKFGDVLQFVIAHNERHVQQALRVALLHPKGRLSAHRVNYS